MQKNVFIKSMLRQPVRSLLLILLIGVASFAFVVRAVEYVVVRRQIQEIASFYNSIGVLHHVDGNIAADISAAAELISSSPYVVFEDKRRGFEAILSDIHNPIILGEYAWFMLILGPGESARFNERWITERDYLLIEQFNLEYLDLFTFFEEYYPGFGHFMSGDAFFYGELLEIEYVHTLPDDWPFFTPPNWTPSYWAPHKNLHVRIDNVLAGYVEHVDEGVEVILRFYLGSDLNENSSLFENVVVGERYFFKATHYSYIATGNWTPHGRQSPYLNTLFLKPLNDYGLWYVPVAPGEEIDFSTPGLEDIPRQILLTNHTQHAMHLRTTRDMTSTPMAVRDDISAVSGRLLNKDDYLYARPVTVIHRLFAERRGLSVGDIITVHVNQEQHLVLSPYSWDFTRAGVGVIGRYICLGILSVPGSYPAYELELEIVGTFEYFHFRADEVNLTTLPKFMYVPDSILPEHLTLLSAPWGDFDFGHVPAAWYSFVLGDSRHQAAFISQYRDTLAEMGFLLEFVGREATNFWITAEMIMQSVTLNLVLFSIVLLLVLMLVIFIYLWQRRKDFAVLRALGCPKKLIQKQVLISIALFWVPAVLIGSWIAWGFALDIAIETLTPFGEIIADSVNVVILTVRDAIVADFLAAALPSLAVLAALCAIILGMMFIFVWSGLQKIVRRPVLELLQGQAAKVEKRTIIPKINVEGHIFRHIVRAPVKTILALVTTLFFVIALGWLGETINRAEAEIDRLYDTTIVYAEIMRLPDDPEQRTRLVYDIIPRRFMERIFEFGVVHEDTMFIEAGNGFSVILPMTGEGTFPHESLEDIIFSRYDNIREIDSPRHMQHETFDHLFAFNNLQDFTEDRRGFIGRETGITDANLHISFAPGFGESSFVYTAGQPIPVIISERISVQRDIKPGDTVFLSHADYIDYLTEILHPTPPDVVPEWHYTTAIVIGIHDGNTLAPHVQDAALLPLAALESLIGPELGYISFRFGINPAYNRELVWATAQIRSVLGGYLRPWFNHLTLIARDEELRLVIDPMEQNLELLRLLYPVAIVLSVVIGAGLSILLLMQNAKNAAIMRVLGSPKTKTRMLLWLELMIVCLTGAVIGLLALTTIRQGFDGFLFVAMIPYLTGAIIGAIIGAVLVTNRAPLDLLQVKE